MPESLRLFQLSAAMEWTHLPVAGGLYDQSFRLLDEWLIIFGVQSEVEKEKEEKEKRERDRKAAKGNGPGGRRGRGR